MSKSKVYIIILNWNGWKDTIECLESVLRLDYDNYRVIVCDNNSSDGSLEYIKAWAEGRLDVYLSQANPLRHLSFPPVVKPIPHRLYDRNDAEKGGVEDDSNFAFILIQTGDNLGFAGGNNVGLRYALAKGNSDFVWLLNNDTVVSQSSLTELVDRMARYPDAGMCGSLLINYQQPDLIQAAGAEFDYYLARGQHLLEGIPVTTPLIESDIIKRMDYVVGASMLVRRIFLDKIGLFNEIYFLYFEEIDWALRAKSFFNIALSVNSHVYHKEGASIGRPKNNCYSLYYAQLNRLRFSYLYNRRNVPHVFLHVLGHACKAIVMGRFSMCFTSLRAAFNFVKTIISIQGNLN
ncbi:MAG TPA: glycosyltransferase family 2 protein [Desulfuromonadaceae bacterium]|jgi:hypothetical protein